MSDDVRRFGRDTTAREVAAQADLHGRTALVTGASSGLGTETARALAAAGADLVLGVRDPARAEPIATRIREETGRVVQVGQLDLGDLGSVEAFGRNLRQACPAIGIFVANAGVSKTLNAHLPNGLDERFAANHLGHFLLAHLLLPSFEARGARLVMVSSGAHKGRPINLEDLQWTRRERSDFVAYGESKTANMLFAMEATRRWSDKGVFANALLPGSVMTGLQRHHSDELKRQIGFLLEDGTPNPAMKTIEQGAATSVWAATAPELEGRGGLVLEDCGLAEDVTPLTHRWSGVDRSVLSPDDAAALWRESLRILEGFGVSVT